MKHTDTSRSGFNRFFSFKSNNPNSKNLVQAFLLPFVLIILFILLLGQSLFAQCTLACNNQINLSIASTCNAEVTYDMILEDPNNPGICSPTGNASFFEVIVMDESGFNTLATSPFVTDNEVGQLLNVKIRHIASNNQCWGTVLVEDKLGPTLTCPADITVQCTEAISSTVTGSPVVSDCSNFTLNTNDQTVNFPCGDPLTQITRTYIATDEYGNSSTCTQLISVANPDVNAVVFPPNLDNNELPALACEDVDANAALTEPGNTGYPTLNGLPIPEGANACGLNIGFTDNIIDICDGTYKIVRSWTVLEWCTSTIINDVQIIKVEDNDGPALVCQPTLSAGTTGTSTCTASVLIPAAQVSDLCSGIDQVSVFSQFGSINTNGGVISNLPIGTTTITYQATDNCGNTSSCSSTLTVSDDDSPTVICDEFTVVTLNSSGLAFVNAITFDDGSYDNCCLEDFTVRRIDGGCGESNNYAEQVKFCCADIGQQVMVQLRVEDCFGNENSCMVQATVEENSAPTIACPTDVTLTCTEDYTDTNLTGTPTATDGCGFTNPVFTDAVNLNTCNVGTIVRTWAVSDNQGNGNNCTQTITLQDNTPFSVNFPPDYTAGACTAPEDLDPEDLPAPFNAPTFVNDDCEQLAVNVSDEFFEVAPPACFKIIRTWKVIDWCVYDASNPNGPGQFSAEQTIIVMDNDAPEVVCPADFTVSTTGDNCAATVLFPQPTVTDCSSEIQVSISNDIGAGFGPFDNVQPGIYNATYFISDGCGNVSTCTLSVTVEEGSLPTPYCVGGLTIELSPVDTDGDGINDNGLIDIWASDFDAGSFDNCGGTISLSLTPDPTQTTLDFTCDNLGANTISLYVTDENGNQDFCQTVLFVESVNNVCSGGDNGPFIIGGAISDESGNMLENVMVSVNDGVTQPNMTDETGHYIFDNMNAGNDFTVSPSHNEDPLNGVTTLDLVFMRRHILSEEILNSPYKIIAADVNNNGSITTADIVELKKIILTTFDGFQSNNSWRFVDAAYVFADPAAPLDEGFPEIYNINNLATDMMAADFIAVKIGDVNGSATTNGFSDNDSEERSDQSLVFTVSEQNLEPEMSYSIPVFADSEIATQSGQFTLNFDTESIDIEEVLIAEDSDFTLSDFAFTHQNEGYLTCAWYRDAAQDYESRMPLFYLQLAAKKTTKLSQTIELNSAKTKAIAYNAYEETMSIHLNFVDREIATTPVQLDQNHPNPFSERTSITFDTGDENVESLQIIDLNGQVLFTQNSNFVRGENQVFIGREIFPTAGVYYYQLNTSSGVLTMKMIVL